MAAPRTGHAMVSYFIKAYENHYGNRPVVNRHKSRYGFDSLLMDMPQAEVESLIDFYMTTASTNSHDINWFLYNYEKLIESKRQTEDDAAKLSLIREASRKRAEEWRRKIDNK